jgi:5'-methylthioadenosine phosphorylase
MRLGIIGGSGLCDLASLGGFVQEELINHSTSTPYGAPSSDPKLFTRQNLEVLFIPRHGEGHRLPPHQVPYRANVYTLKALRCDALISVSAVGSLKKEIFPGHFVIPDQYIDKTWRRETTYVNGIHTWAEPVTSVIHVAMGNPMDSSLKMLLQLAYEKAAQLNPAMFDSCKLHTEKVYLCIEGPHFSTRAESKSFAREADIIGMTMATEAKLARELHLPFVNLSLVTDYDAWRPEVDAVTHAEVSRVVKQNVQKALKVLSEFCDQVSRVDMNYAPGHLVFSEPMVLSIPESC